VDSKDKLRAAVFVAGLVSGLFAQLAVTVDPAYTGPAVIAGLSCIAGAAGR
jgi:hypothetical protein